MSNCIQILNPEIRFPYPYFDTQRFAICWAQVPDEMPEFDDPKNGWWWFLSTNVIFEINGDVRILLGQGRSSHTHRDLRWTLIQLAKFVLRDTDVHVIMKDEYDNFESIFIERYQLLADGRLCRITRSGVAEIYD